MNRRDFLRTAGGATALASSAAAAGAAAAQEGGNETAAGNNTTATPTGNETATPSGSGGGGTTKTVKVGPGGSLVFDPAKIYVKPGDTVKWVWESDDHNVVPGKIPDGASWEGTAGGPGKTYDTGHTYSHTFTTKGKYHYWCQPHKTAGMIGDVIVNESGQAPGKGGGGGEADPEHMGVPFQAHFVGISTVLMIIVSLIFTFFTLKYGESPHASGGND